MKATFLVLLMLSVGISRVAAGQSPAVIHNSWSSGVPLPTAVAWSTTGVIKGKIYNVGGVTANSAVVGDNQIYEPATDTWSAGASMPTPLSLSASAVVKNVLYVFGGNTNGNFSGITDQVWAYNPTTNVWAMKTAMPTKRQSALAVVENNIIYVIGGANKNGHKLTTVDSYDSATDSWSEEAPLLVGKSKPGGGLLKSTIVAADGTSNSDITGDNEGYDASTNSWTSLAADPDARSATCYGSVGANLYSAAGFDSNLNPINISEAFSLSKNKWTTKASIPQAVIAPGSAVYKGLLYCFGGGSSPDIPIDGVVYNNVQIYQP